MSAPEPWTTERIREAFIYDGGESAYYDPIDGDREQRRIAGAIFDAWLATHDAEIADRLTAPPTDDEREALADVVKDADFSAPDDSLQGVDEYWRAWKLHMADQILAAGFRRQGPITDEMADSAQRAWHDYVWGPGEPMARRDLGITRQAWKAALEAAERAR